MTKQSEKSPEIAFYIGLKNVKKSIEDADLNIGNPGVGGTQYLFLLTVKKYNEKYNETKALLLTDGELDLKDDAVPYVVVKSESEAIRYCEEQNIKVLVLNANVADSIDEKSFNTEVKIALWAHNTLTWSRQLVAARNQSIQYVVCVSEKQYENMRDTPCWEKCTYINNIIPNEFYENATLSNHAKPMAAYIGSIMPQKGVHNLLEVWKYVEAEEPEAQLYIYGGANVWNASAKLGSNGAADIYYDRVIQRRMKRLKHPENIHFMGAKGWKELDTLLSSTRVGIVNPSHYMRDETFCMSAIEMEAHKIPVVSRQRNDGLNTTILNEKTGFLGKTDREIAKYISLLLHDQSKSMKMGDAARCFARNFTPDNEIYKWKAIAENTDKCTNCSFSEKKKSSDAKLLQHDFALKIGYLIESGKAVDLVARKLKKNNR